MAIDLSRYGIEPSKAAAPTTSRLDLSRYGIPSDVDLSRYGIPSDDGYESAIASEKRRAANTSPAPSATYQSDDPVDAMSAEVEPLRLRARAPLNSMALAEAKKKLHDDVAKSEAERAEEASKTPWLETAARSAANSMPGGVRAAIMVGAAEQGIPLTREWVDIADQAHRENLDAIDRGPTTARVVGSMAGSAPYFGIMSAPRSVAGAIGHGALVGAVGGANESRGKNIRQVMSDAGKSAVAGGVTAGVLQRVLGTAPVRALAAPVDDAATAGLQAARAAKEIPRGVAGSAHRKENEIIQALTLGPRYQGSPRKIIGRIDRETGEYQTWNRTRDWLNKPENKELADNIIEGREVIGQEAYRANGLAQAIAHKEAQAQAKVAADAVSKAAAIVKDNPKISARYTDVQKEFDILRKEWGAAAREDVRKQIDAHERRVANKFWSKGSTNPKIGIEDLLEEKRAWGSVYAKALKQEGAATSVDDEIAQHMTWAYDALIEKTMDRASKILKGDSADAVKSLSKQWKDANKNYSMIENVRTALEEKTRRGVQGAPTVGLAINSLINLRALRDKGLSLSDAAIARFQRSKIGAALTKEALPRAAAPIGAEVGKRAPVVLKYGNTPEDK